MCAEGCGRAGGPHRHVWSDGELVGREEGCADGCEQVSEVCTCEDVCALVRRSCVNMC